MAADIVRPPPAAKPVVVVPRAYDWSGHYFGIQGGWETHHQVSHVDRRGKPEGVNVLFMDGHVTWRPFKEMKLRTDSYPYWWF